MHKPHESNFDHMFKVGGLLIFGIQEQKRNANIEKINRTNLKKIPKKLG